MCDFYNLFFFFMYKLDFSSRIFSVLGLQHLKNEITCDHTYNNLAKYRFNLTLDEIHIELSRRSKKKEKTNKIPREIIEMIKDQMFAILSLRSKRVESVFQM